MDDASTPYLFRGPRSTPESRGGRPPEHRFENRPGMVIEKDIAVPFGDEGHVMYVDVYRPEGDVPAAPLVSWSPYGKHNPAPIGQIYPNSGVRPEWTSDLTTFEAPDPEYWVPHGYAIVLADVPGTWYSEGRATYHSPEEARAFADLVEWAGTQPWSAGKVGLSGVSYLSSLQWFVAALNPPHLAAINPWEGWNDTYREVARHGGIPETSFWPYIWERWGAGTTEIEDLESETAAHPWFDEFWASKAADLEAIRVPAFVVASWADQGLHSRGTLEGFRRIGSAQKWLDVHGRKKWAYYYEPENIERQRGLLRPLPARQGHRHRVLAAGARGGARAVRARAPGGRRGNGRSRTSSTGSCTWTPPAARWAGSRPPPRALRPTTGWAAGWRPAGPRSRSPSPSRWSWSATSARCCTCPPTRPRTWTCSSRCSSSTPTGNQVGFPYYGQFEDGPVAVGWLRASHRELDPERSTDYLPVLAHRRALPLTPGEPARLDIEVWPSGTRFEAGEQLAAGRPGQRRHALSRAADLRPARRLGERRPQRRAHRRPFDSHLVVPVLPPRS